MRIYFKELAHTIVSADKSEIHRAGQLEIQVRVDVAFLNTKSTGYISRLKI